MAVVDVLSKLQGEYLTAAYELYWQNHTSYDFTGVFLIAVGNGTNICSLVVCIIYKFFCLRHNVSKGVFRLDG